MVGSHHRLNGHEFEQVPRDDEGQGSLACCSPWGNKDSDMTEQLNNKLSIANGCKETTKCGGKIIQKVCGEQFIGLGIAPAPISWSGKTIHRVSVGYSEGFALAVGKMLD